MTKQDPPGCGCALRSLLQETPEPPKPTCHRVLGDDLPLHLLKETCFCVVEVVFPHSERLKTHTHTHTTLMITR